MDQINTPPPQGEEQGRGLAIAGLVLGVISIMIAFIPCVGVFSVIPAIVGIIVSAISIVQTNKQKLGNNIAIAGLVCSVVACCIAGLQIYFVKMASSKMEESYIEFERSGGFDSLSSRIMSLQITSDSLEKEEEREK